MVRWRLCKPCEVQWYSNAEDCWSCGVQGQPYKPPSMMSSNEMVRIPQTWLDKHPV